MAIKWLSLYISPPEPIICLCLYEKEYLSVVRSLKVEKPNGWMLTPQAIATAHSFDSSKGLTIVVCLRGWEDKSPVAIAGILTHESVHAWQRWCDYYGEETPGREQEAYAIQLISQMLIKEFDRRTNVFNPTPGNMVENECKLCKVVK